jgi:hypothetical protein
VVVGQPEIKSVSLAFRIITSELPNLLGSNVRVELSEHKGALPYLGPPLAAREFHRCAPIDGLATVLNAWLSLVAGVSVRLSVGSTASCACLCYGT